jgi:hypothetical protein
MNADEKRAIRNARATAWRIANPERWRDNIRKWEEANSDRLPSIRKAWVVANPEKRKAIVKASNRKRAATKKAWRIAHPEADRQYYEKNKEKLAAKRRAYRKVNRGKYNARRAERERKFTVAQRCKCCGAKEFAQIYTIAHWCGAHVDHIKPLALGGPHCCKNLQILTVADHRKKTAKDMRDIAQARRR